MDDKKLEKVLAIAQELYVDIDQVFRARKEREPVFFERLRAFLDEMEHYGFEPVRPNTKVD